MKWVSSSIGTWGRNVLGPGRMTCSTGSWPVGVPALGRQAGGQPVELTGHVVVDLGEPKALEPPRGSWAEVSGRVPAVHDDGPAWVERPSGLGLELAEGQVDRTREVVFLELFRGQDVDHLGALLHKILNLLPADLPHAGHLAASAQALPPTT